MIRNYISLLILSFTTLSGLHAQDYDFEFIDKVYVENIETVRFGPSGLEHLFPLATLSGAAALQLSFDDMDAGVKDYVYTFIHCDRDWLPSNLTPLEYIDGFEEEYIQDYDFSYKTLHNYTNYWVSLPNNNIGWTKTGNYLLVVYEDEYDKIPVITRRFVVATRDVAISANMVRPAQVSKMRTHQEIDFTADHQKIGVRNPKMELRAAVIQNGRWDNSITNLEPKFIRNGEAVFDYQDKVVFAGGNEFRVIDTRSLMVPPYEIEDVTYYPDDSAVEVTMRPVPNRAYTHHISYQELNGGFTTGNTDRRLDQHLSAEYADVFLTLQDVAPFYENHVYLFGALTEWRLKPEFQFTYNAAIRGYVGRFRLKQGYYNYALVTAPSDTEDLSKEVPDFDDVEGNFSDTENNYLILIYYRPFGSRYDQVVGAYQLNSMDN